MKYKKERKKERKKEKKQERSMPARTGDFINPSLTFLILTKSYN